MQRNNASFRDEGGFVFHHRGMIFRQIDESYREHYEHFIASGLYDSLTTKGLLLKHSEEDVRQFPDLPKTTFKVIRPDLVQFISYPYEWSFHQLKDAALTTLKIQKIALEHGMILKDASAFNIQFVGGKPCLIDTLSFLKLGEKIEPWIAYKQ